MKKRGFTLIELLAVIVVLAIIALIAVPVILNIIENARKASAIDSSYGYVKAVENYLIRKELKNEEKEIKVGENNVEDVTKVISVKGTKPTSGIIEINEKNVVTKGTNLCILGYSVQYEAGKESYISGKCNEEEKEEIIEDKVACELEKETIDGKEYYYVDSVCDLYALSKNVSSGTSYQNKIVKLRNNLDMSKIDNNTKKYIEENKDYFTEEELKINERFMPIGTSSKQFSGTFDGNAKTISNLIINRPTMTYVGLFGVNNGTVKGITLDSIDISGKDATGGVSGKSNGKVIDVVVTGTIKGNNNVGGINGQGNATSAIVNVNVLASGGSVSAGIGSNGTMNGLIVEGGTLRYGNTNKANIANGSGAAYNVYYSDKTDGANNQGIKIDSSALGNINAYESAIDTYIGGDDDDSGYYFDYDKNGKIVIKSIEKDPIEFKLKGSGTESDPYLIGSYEDWKMATIKADQVGVYFKLTKDIDFTGKRFYMLGSYQNKFKGVLDGDNHTINGIKTEGGSFQGIIGSMYSDSSKVKNLNIKDFSITKASTYVGIIGHIDRGTVEGITIENETIESTMSAGDTYIGGLAGYNTGTIKGITCKNINITGKNRTGGITGQNTSSVMDVVVTGTIKGATLVGGINGLGSATSGIVNVDVLASGESVSAGIGSNGTMNGLIVEGGTLRYANTNKANIANGSGAAYNVYYSDKTDGANNQGIKIDSSALGNINAYESAIDTYIGGDDDDSGYYFDYDKNGKIVIKSIEKDPIEFKLKGSGTESDPYLIGSYEDWKMATIKADQVGVYFKLTKDIDFTGKRFYMLGSYQNKFKGVLDGDNHTINGIKTEGGSFQGIIGSMYSDSSKVKNLNIKDFSITKASTYVGIIGHIDRGTVEGITIENETIESTMSAGDTYIGGLAGYNTGTIKGITCKNINITGKNRTGGITGQNTSSVMEVVVTGTIKGNSGVGGINGLGSATSAIVNVNVLASGQSVSAGIGSSGTMSGLIVEGGTLRYANTNKANIANGSGAAYNVYYSDKTDGANNQGIKYSSTYINDLTYYDGILDTTNKPIIESKYTGDVNGSGYFFDYGSDGKIKVVKAYTYDKGTANVDENYTMTKIVGTTDTTAPTCGLDYVIAVSNGIRASFSCTDESGTPEVSSLFDSTTSKSAEEFENIGTVKKGVVNGNKRSVITTWTTNDSVSKPTKGTCYYFRYGARDSSGNYSTYVTDKCYRGFN